MLNHLNLKTVLYVSIVVVGVVVFIKATAPTDAQQDMNSKRQTDLKEWQSQVDAWRQSETAKSHNTDFTGQGITQLPNTGPKD